VYIGEGLSLPYYQKLYGCESNPQVRKLSLHSLRQEIARAQSHSPLVVVEVNQWLERFLPPRCLLTYPWIRQVTDLQGERYQQRKRGIERGFGQRVRRHNLQVRFTREAKDVEVFYREYYLPHIRARHGSLAIGRALPQLKEAVRSGFLLQIWWGDQWVSGVVAEWAESDRVSPLAVGLHPNHLESWQNGVLAAGYYFLFRWALENGVRWLDFGGSPPHLQSGVYRHKALWAAEPERDPWHHTQLAFYLNPSAPLPEIVTQQLIWRHGQFVSISESLQGRRSSPPTVRRACGI
jgi:hypothetical protein